jgi:hypothetical protein
MSLQTFANWHPPVSSLQEPSVQGSSSSQVTGSPLQRPPLHWSSSVQFRPSSQPAWLFGCVQVPVALQTSFVQTLLSDEHGVLFGSKALAGQVAA